MDFSGKMDSEDSKNRVSGFGEKFTPRRLPEAMTVSMRLMEVNEWTNLSAELEPKVWGLRCRDWTKMGRAPGYSIGRWVQLPHCVG
jgi:hypothetical protein